MGGFMSLMAGLHPSAKFIIFLIVLIFAVSFILSLIIRLKYLKIQSDLDDEGQKRRGRYNSPILNRIIDDYKSAAMGSYNEVNTQAIIEKCFNEELRNLNIGERFVKHSVSLLIVLGLLGTFLGLTLSISELDSFIKTIGSSILSEGFMSIIDNLKDALGTMAVAFTTSLFGIACSVILTIFSILFNVESTRETLMVNIEEYLDNTVALIVSKDKETEYSMMNKILRSTFEEFGEKIEKSLKQTVQTFGESLSRVVMEVDVSSKTLDSTVEKFDASLKNFAEDIKDFTEFNINLRNNIERMDVSFIKVTEALTNTSKIIVDNYSFIEDFSKNIKDAADEMTAYNSQVIKDVANLIEEVKSTVSSIDNIGKALSDDMTKRIEEVHEYQHKFNELMEKLSGEIELLGEKTAESFKESLSTNGKAVTDSIGKDVKNVLSEVFVMLDNFTNNEKMFAKTINMLPDKVLAYNEIAAAKMDKQLEEVKKICNKNDNEGK